MATFILTWNPFKWQMDPGEQLRAKAETAAGQVFEERWSTGSRTSGITPGDRGFLLRQENQRGILALGRFTSAPYQDAHWDGSGRLANYADLAWVTWISVDDRLPTERLLATVPGVPWNNLQSSGVQVVGGAEIDLAAAWDEHCSAIGAVVIPGADELRPSERYREGASVPVTVNRYERDPGARAACIAHHGTTCQVCGFDFGRVYGERGDGFIHVHHVTPISQLPADYEVDPLTDLLPVCANCHAMIHHGENVLSPQELRELIVP